MWQVFKSAMTKHWLKYGPFDTLDDLLGFQLEKL